MYTDDGFLQLSGIQHFAFCRRQWALIHIEQLWEENRLTAEGRVLHEKAHDPFFTEKRGDVIIRFYSLGNNYKNNVEHYGTKASFDVTEPLII